MSTPEVMQQRTPRKWIDIPNDIRVRDVNFGAIKGHVLDEYCSAYGFLEQL